MNTSQPTRLPRRRVVAAGLGALALGVPAAREAAARPLLSRGMAGGGMAQFGEPESPNFANFAMFASSMTLPDGKTLYIGQLRWTEAGTGFQMTSEWINQCIPIEGRTDGAEVRGKVTTDGTNRYPFVAHIFDVDDPGAGLDRIELAVNTPDAQEFFPQDPVVEDFVYEASGTLIAGDFQWIIRDIEIEI